MASLKVGIVGAGSVSELHARGYERDPRVQVHAVCDRDADRAIQRSLEWGAGAFYTDLGAMLADDELDAVDILTPHHLHAEQAIAALRAGKHVCLERPIALSLDEGRRVVQAAQQSGRVLQVFEPGLFYKPLLDARNLIDAQEIGKPTSIQIRADIARATGAIWRWQDRPRSTWRFDEELAGGSPMLFDVVYQAFCIALFLIGGVERVEVWRGETEVADGLKLDAPSVAMWKHVQQACFGSLHLNWAPDRTLRTDYHPVEIVARVAGTRGDLEVVRSSDTTQLGPRVALRRDSRRADYGQRTTAFEESFERAAKNFVSACLGEEEPLLGGLEALQLLTLTRAYQQAADHGRPVRLNHA